MHKKGACEVLGEPTHVLGEPSEVLKEPTYVLREPTQVLKESKREIWWTYVLPGTIPSFSVVKHIFSDLMKRG